MPQAIIELKGVGKSFRSADGSARSVLEGVDFRLAEGEIVSLLGQSGSGKSTMLRIMAGLIQADSGEVRLRDQPLYGPARGVSMVFQSFALFPWLTVQQNVELGLEARGVEPTERARRAASAIEHHDEKSARVEVDHAAASWPIQPAYLWARVVLAARGRDTVAALDALERFAALGLGHDLRSDSALASLLRAPAFSTVAAAHERNRVPLVRSHVRVILADSTFWPEGMDVDPRTHRIYVASVRHRTIAEVAADGSTRELWPRDRHDLGAMLGVRVDAARGVLWATTSGVRQMQGWIPGDTGIAALLRIRVSDGSIERRWDLPPIPGGHVLGDLAIGPHGDVFVTDSNDPVLYRLRPGADTLESVRSPLFHSLQGLAPSPDGRALFLSDYSHGLLRVDLATHAVTRLADAPSSTSLGCDGIAWDRGAIVAVQNGVSPARVIRFVLDPSWTRVSRVDVVDRNSAVADEPTIGAVDGGEFVYVANSQWNKHDDRGTRLSPVPLTAPIILAAPLPP